MFGPGFMLQEPASIELTFQTFDMTAGTYDNGFSVFTGYTAGYAGSITREGIIPETELIACASFYDGGDFSYVSILTSTYFPAMDTLTGVEIDGVPYEFDAPQYSATGDELGRWEFQGILATPFVYTSGNTYTLEFY